MLSDLEFIVDDEVLTLQQPHEDVLREVDVLFLLCDGHEVCVDVVLTRLTQRQAVVRLRKQKDS